MLTGKGTAPSITTKRRKDMKNNGKLQVRSYRVLYFTVVDRTMGGKRTSSIKPTTSFGLSFTHIIHMDKLQKFSLETPQGL